MRYENIGQSVVVGRGGGGAAISRDGLGGGLRGAFWIQEKISSVTLMLVDFNFFKDFLIFESKYSTYKVMVFHFVTSHWSLQEWVVIRYSRVDVFCK